MSEKKIYLYVVCTQCGCDKKESKHSWCGKCSYASALIKGKKKYSYSKCNKCGGKKPPNASSWCSKCCHPSAPKKERTEPFATRYEYLKTYRQMYDQLTEEEKEQRRIDKLNARIERKRLEQIANEKKAEKRLIKKSIETIIEAIVEVEEVTQLDCLQSLPEKIVVVDEKKAFQNEVILFVETLINRNHFASTEDLLMVSDYHNELFNFQRKYQAMNGIDQVCMMYRDLCKFYKKKKSTSKP